MHEKAHAANVPIEKKHNDANEYAYVRTIDLVYRFDDVVERVCLAPSATSATGASIVESGGTSRLALGSIVQPIHNVTQTIAEPEESVFVMITMIAVQTRVARSESEKITVCLQGETLGIIARRIQTVAWESVKRKVASVTRIRIAQRY